VPKVFSAKALAKTGDGRALVSVADMMAALLEIGLANAVLGRRGGKRWRLGSMLHCAYVQQE
jgi:hypothetical protein